MDGGDAAVKAAPSEKGIFGIPQTGFFIRGSFYSCKAYPIPSASTAPGGGEEGSSKHIGLNPSQ